jgi:hypothetical protein
MPMLALPLMLGVKVTLSTVPPVAMHPECLPEAAPGVAVGTGVLVCWTAGVAVGDKGVTVPVAVGVPCERCSALQTPPLDGVPARASPT